MAIVNFCGLRYLTKCQFFRTWQVLQKNEYYKGDKNKNKREENTNSKIFELCDNRKGEDNNWLYFFYLLRFLFPLFSKCVISIDVCRCYCRVFFSLYPKLGELSDQKCERIFQKNYSKYLSKKTKGKQDAISYCDEDLDNKNNKVKDDIHITVGSIVIVSMWIGTGELYYRYNWLKRGEIPHSSAKCNDMRFLCFA